MLTEITVVDKIEILENGIIQVREANKILRDEEIIAQTYHRTSFIPGQDLAKADPKVVAIAQTVWTPEVVAAYQEQQNKLIEEARKLWS